MSNSAKTQAIVDSIRQTPQKYDLHEADLDSLYTTLGMQLAMEESPIATLGVTSAIHPKVKIPRTYSFAPEISLHKDSTSLADKAKGFLKNYWANIVN